MNQKLILKLVTPARLLLGFLLLVFGLNGFFHFMPQPPPSAEAGALLGAFAKTGYFFPFIKSVEMLVGVLLLTNLFVPLALAVIFPIFVGIFQIHLFLDPAGLPIAGFLMGIHAFITLSYWQYFKTVLTKSTVLTSEDK